MLDAGRLPAAQRVRGVVRQHRPRRPGDRPDRRRRFRRRRQGRQRRDRTTKGSPTLTTTDPPTTVVHLLRHGEVRNPDGILYGRLRGYELSDLGRRMAERVADTVKERDITHLVASPLQRAQETAAAVLPRRSVSTPSSTRGSSRRRTGSRACGSASATARCASRRTGGTSTTRSGPPGGSRTRTSPCGCWPPCTTHARRPRGTRR